MFLILLNYISQKDNKINMFVNDEAHDRVHDMVNDFWKSLMRCTFFLGARAQETFWTRTSSSSSPVFYIFCLDT